MMKEVYAITVMQIIVPVKTVVLFFITMMQDILHMMIIIIVKTVMKNMTLLTL